jgi:hypothetical protein
MAIFANPVQKKLFFSKIEIFHFLNFCLKMDLVALPGKNNRISDVSDPN